MKNTFSIIASVMLAACLAGCNGVSVTEESSENLVRTKVSVGGSLVATLETNDIACHNVAFLYLHHLRTPFLLGVGRCPADDISAVGPEQGCAIGSQGV